MTIFEAEAPVPVLVAEALALGHGSVWVQYDVISADGIIHMIAIGGCWRGFERASPEERACVEIVRDYKLRKRAVRQI